MLVGELLELDGQSPLLDEARERWSSWAAADSRLTVVSSFDELRAWLDARGPAEKDPVLLALAARAATDGGDDPAAAAALAKCLLPGASLLACELAARLRGRVEDVDQLVASQLWIEVRTFPWRRLERLAANVLASIRNTVLLEAGAQTLQHRHDRTWAHTQLHEAFGTDRDYDPLLPVAVAGAEASATTQMLEVLAWACESKVISTDDRALLLSLVDEAAQHDEVSRFTLGNGGLTSEDVAAGVARQLGVSAVTVRRRGARSMRAISVAIPEGLLW